MGKEGTETRHNVVFSKSGKTVEWESSEGSLLELGETYGVDLSSACRAGNCGTCEVAIKSGDVSYTVKPGHQSAEGSILTCCAIPKSDIEIDA